MTRTIDEGAASAVPQFNPSTWAAAWTAIGGGFALTSSGLFISWDRVTDHEERTRLHQQVAPVNASRTLIDYLDARQAGEVTV